MCDAAAQAAFIKSVTEQILNAYYLPGTDRVLCMESFTNTKILQSLPS